MPQELITAEGKVAWIGRTTLWGEVTEEHSHKDYGTDCTLRFPGQWYDEESKLCYNWHRYYDPETARNGIGVRPLVSIWSNSEASREGAS